MFCIYQLIYKYFKKEDKQINDIQSIQIGAHTSPYNEYIKEIYIFPELKITYYSDSQLEWYNRYSNFEYAILSIDVTGGIIQSNG